MENLTSVQTLFCAGKCVDGQYLKKVSSQTYCVGSCGDDFLFSESGSEDVWCSANCTYNDQVKNYVVGTGPEYLTNVCVSTCSALGNLVINDSARYCQMCKADTKVSYGKCIGLAESCPSEIPYVQTIGDLKVCSAQCSSKYWKPSNYNRADRWCIDECDTKIVDQERQCVSSCATDFFVFVGDHYECRDKCDGFTGVDPGLKMTALRCVQSCTEFSGLLPYLNTTTNMCVGKCGSEVYNDTTKICLKSKDSCAYYRNDSI